MDPPQLSVSIFFFFSSRRRHTRWTGDWSSDVCSSDLNGYPDGGETIPYTVKLTNRGTGIAPSVTGVLRSLDGLCVISDKSEERRVGKECRSRWWREH